MNSGFDATQKQTHLAMLLDELSRRQQRNPRYSLRAFARDLGLSPSFLSQVLGNIRRLSPETSRQIAEKLAWSAKQTDLFLGLAALDGVSDPALKGRLVAEVHRFFENGN